VTYANELFNAGYGIGSPKLIDGELAVTDAEKATLVM
jgi:hypothetical protein